MAVEQVFDKSDEMSDLEFQKLEEKLGTPTGEKSEKWTLFGDLIILLLYVQYSIIWKINNILTTFCGFINSIYTIK